MTITFALVMAVLLAGLGAFVYLRLQAQLNAAADQGLRARVDGVAALIREAETGIRNSGEDILAPGGEGFAQILTAEGRLVDSTPPLGEQPILTRAEAARAIQAPVVIERSDLNGIGGPTRLLASRVVGHEQVFVAVVGASLEERDGALSDLAILLMIGGTGALLLASAAGYGAVTSALRPVEVMRRRANAISTLRPEERLPLAAADDELHRLGETLNRMLDRLALALDRERQFVNDASHELRTPLALHRAELELALRYDEGPERLRESVRSAIEEADRLIELAEAMLLVARSEKGDLTIALERRPVSSLLEDARLRFAVRAAEAGRDLGVELTSATELEIDVDPMRIRQALTNMVDNALRHGAGAVSISATVADRVVELHVRDQGNGFPEDFLDTAFDRFSRADEARHATGSGLGLAIVAAIAGAHGGSAEACNHPSGGADVWIAIPTPGLAN